MDNRVIIPITMKKTRKIFLAIGILLLVLMISVFGVDKLIADILSVGLGFFLLMFIYFLNHVFLTYGWRVLIMYPLGLKGFIKLLIARIAGDSTTVINAAAGAAGDPIKALYIKDTVPLNTGLASVFLDRIVHSIGNLLIILTGIILAAFLLGIPFWAVIAAAVVIIGGIFYGISYISKKKNFLIHVVNSLPQFIQKRFITRKRRSSLKKIDKEFAHIFSSKSNLNHFYISVILHYLPVMLSGTFEVYFIMKFLSVSNLSFINALFIYLFGLVVSIVLPFIPLNLAISEGSYAAACSYFGYETSVGVSIGFIRRARALAWSFIGIGFLLYAGLLKKETTPEEKKKKRK